MALTTQHGKHATLLMSQWGMGNDKKWQRWGQQQIDDPHLRLPWVPLTHPQLQLEVCILSLLVTWIVMDMDKKCMAPVSEIIDYLWKAIGQLLTLCSPTKYPAYNQLYLFRKSKYLSMDSTNRYKCIGLHRVLVTKKGNRADKYLDKEE